MTNEFAWERRVEFCETDAAGIAHFSSLIIYMEQAEHALLRSLGLSVAPAASAAFKTVAPEQDLCWPRVRVEIDFQTPVRFDDSLYIFVGITHLGNKSVTFRHRMLKGQTPVATGSVTSVCCKKQDGKLVGIPMPETTRNLLSPYVVA